MPKSTHTATFSKEEALRLYRIECLMYRTAPRYAEDFPTGKEINAWHDAAVIEAERRLREIALSPEKSFEIVMFYDRPKDIIDSHNRLSGNEKDPWEE